jgi:hypothetical protein
MDCLRSFSLRINTNTGLGGSDIKTWTDASLQTYWSAYNGASTNSIFNIQGFKNIDIYFSIVKTIFCCITTIIYAKITVIAVRTNNMIIVLFHLVD